jgi:hypothetical protein
MAFKTSNNSNKEIFSSSDFDSNKKNQNIVVDELEGLLLL